MTLPDDFYSTPDYQTTSDQQFIITSQYLHETVLEEVFCEPDELRSTLSIVDEKSSMYHDVRISPDGFPVVYLTTCEEEAYSDFEIWVPDRALMIFMMTENESVIREDIFNRNMVPVVWEYIKTTDIAAIQQMHAGSLCATYEVVDGVIRIKLGFETESARLEFRLLR